jgi:hypothetical protein
MCEHKNPEPQLRYIHRTCSYHRAAIEQSEVCGCFYCKRTFPPSAINEWCDRSGGDQPGQTALCPHCGIDSVIGSASGHAITDDLLARMRYAYFDRPHPQRNRNI